MQCRLQLSIQIQIVAKCENLAFSKQAAESDERSTSTA